MNVQIELEITTIMRRSGNRANTDPRIWYKGKQIRIDHNPKIGVCNLCRAVVPFDCKLTHIHHELHDEHDPLAHTLEVCLVCHNKISGRGINGGIHGDFGYYKGRWKPN